MLETIMRLDIPLYRYDIFGMHRRTWDAGNEPYLQKNDPKYTEITEPERKMAEHVEIKRQASSQNEPFRVVSVPAQHLPSGSVCFSEQQTWTCRRTAHAVSLYRGSCACSLLLLRQALDFSYKEELVMTSLADYVEQVRTWVEEVPVPQKNDPVLQEEIVDKITRSIRQTAATGSHFSKMLSPEEEEIMKEIIREFMNAE